MPYRQRKTSVVAGQRAKDNICVRSLSSVRRVINCPSLSKRWLKASSAALAHRPAREINNEQCRRKVGLRKPFLPIPHPLPLSFIPPTATPFPEDSSSVTTMCQRFLRGIIIWCFVSRDENMRKAIFFINHFTSDYANS